jgi:hypothetical protein
MLLMTMSTLISFTDFDESKLEDLIRDLSESDFDPYLTSVGGGGLGILSAHGQHGSINPRAGAGPMTPPETPDESVIQQEDVKDEDNRPASLLHGLETQTISDLATWAEARGRWLFV